MGVLLTKMALYVIEYLILGLKMSRMTRESSGRSIYATKISNPAVGELEFNFEQVELCTWTNGPQLHEIFLIEESVWAFPNMVRDKWLEVYEPTLHTRDWVLVRSECNGTHNVMLSTTSMRTWTSRTGMQHVQAMAQMEVIEADLKTLDFKYTNYLRDNDYVHNSIGDFQSLLECLQRCFEDYWQNWRFTFEYRGIRRGVCSFVERFFATKSPHAVRLLYITSSWRCVIYGDGTFHTMYLEVESAKDENGLVPKLELHLNAELNDYTDEDWSQLHQILYQKHWAVTATLGDWQMSVGCPLSMSAEQRVARITDLAGRGGIELNDAAQITFAPVAAFLPFKEIHDTYLRYVIALASVPLALFVIKKIFLMVTDEFLAIPDHIATRLIQNVRHVYQYRAALFEQFESGVSENAWRVQPARGTKRRALLGIQIDLNERKLDVGGAGCGKKRVRVLAKK